MDKHKLILYWAPLGHNFLHNAEEIIFFRDFTENSTRHMRGPGYILLLKKN